MNKDRSKKTYPKLKFVVSQTYFLIPSVALPICWPVAEKCLMRIDTFSMKSAMQLLLEKACTLFHTINSVIHKFPCKTFSGLFPLLHAIAVCPQILLLGIMCLRTIEWIMLVIISIVCLFEWTLSMKEGKWVSH